MQKIRIVFMRAAAVAAMLAAPAAASAQNLVSNGGFETGDLSGWTTTSCGFGTGNFGHAPEGTYTAHTGCFSHSPATMQQTLSTMVGQNYNLRFFGGCSSGACVRDGLQVNFGGVNVFSQSMGGNTTFSQGGVEWGYFTLTTGPATSASTVLEFRMWNDPAIEYLDDVTVTAAVTATPEPASMVLLATGLLGIGAIARRRKA